MDIVGGATSSLCEVLRACKLRTGGDFPIWCRIDAVEFSTQNGITCIRPSALLEEIA